eukprot:880467-Rhodomonas_salina.2
MGGSKGDGMARGARGSSEMGGGEEKTPRGHMQVAWTNQCEHTHTNMQTRCIHASSSQCLDQSIYLGARVGRVGVDAGDDGGDASRSPDPRLPHTDKTTTNNRSVSTRHTQSTAFLARSGRRLWVFVCNFGGHLVGLVAPGEVAEREPGGAIRCLRTGHAIAKRAYLGTGHGTAA